MFHLHKNTKMWWKYLKVSPRPIGSAQKESLPVILVKIREKEKFWALVAFYTFVSTKLWVRYTMRFFDIGLVMKMMMTLILSREANKVSTDAPTILCLEKRKVMRWSPPFKIFPAFHFWNPFIVIIKTKRWNEGHNPFSFYVFEEKIL